MVQLTKRLEHGLIAAGIAAAVIIAVGPHRAQLMPVFAIQCAPNMIENGARWGFLEEIRFLPPRRWSSPRKLAHSRRVDLLAGRIQPALQDLGGDPIARDRDELNVSADAEQPIVGQWVPTLRFHDLQAVDTRVDFVRTASS
jgi:hypothetical protein